jgi:hypothetical protein
MRPSLACIAYLPLSMAFPFAINPLAVVSTLLSATNAGYKLFLANDSKPNPWVEYTLEKLWAMNTPDSANEEDFNPLPTVSYRGYEIPLSALDDVMNLMNDLSVRCLLF